MAVQHGNSTTYNLLRGHRSVGHVIWIVHSHGEGSIIVARMMGGDLGVVKDLAHFLEGLSGQT